MNTLAMRIVYGIWLAGWALLMLKALSAAAFSRYPDRWQRFLKAAVLAPFWPLALLSAQGRDAMRAVFFYRGGIE